MYSAATESRQPASTRFMDKLPKQKRPNIFVRVMRKAYRPLGFQKGYNFTLFFIFGGAMLGFCLARFSYLSIAGQELTSFMNGASPGEWYHYKTGYKRIGITLHLAGILPAGFLMVWQFVPVIRHKLLIFHRINGYLIILLVTVANAGALMIARNAFGGGIEVQAGVGLLAIITSISMLMAYYNVKRLQIDQHRAWMLRGMFCLATIITTRLIQILATIIVSMLDVYRVVQSCEQIAFVNSPEAVAEFYPQCANATGSQAGAFVIVDATFDGRVEQIGGSLDITFGMAIWLALIMHLVGVEIYLALTPVEGQRLRNVSYERQLEAGFKNPGSAGLTSDRWGDAPRWEPSHSPVSGTVH